MINRKILMYKKRANQPLFQFFSLVVFFGLMAIGSPSRATDTTGASTSTIATADPLATQKTKAVLNYLSNLPTGTSNRIISGQFEEINSYGSGMSNDIAGIYSKTGKYVGMMGRDYRWDNANSANNLIISYSNSGGLITISDHFDNPATGGDAWDTSNVDFTQLITNGTTSNNRFKGYLDSLSTNLGNLQNNNVVALFRPFHEMNGSWFWWGGKDPQQYKNLWIYTFNYLTQTKGLHNLLWVYSSNGDLDLTYYPGSQYVDVVGVDLYGTGSAISKVSGYDQLTSLGKPFGLTEWGTCGGGVTWTPSACSPSDISGIGAGIRQNMPKTVFWMAWNGVYSMNYNNGVSALLSDPWVITRDEISLSGGPSDTTPPSAPTNLRIR